ncbi:hypothetical protein FYL09_07925 [Lactobacillus salivarius]|uniref:hypothetical protein n=1 Tax=Ligilactobacillus salivarius TaxID=1624 RepID=UPI00136FD0C2|nr:hypothetical protein [Ligilactobacillus salivarius]MYZ65052.1 hypothetical protein [Ligilactobacillus salivarius]
MSTEKFAVKVNGAVVENVEDGFEFGQGELLWQALSEQARQLNIAGISDDEDRLADWQNLDDDNIGVLLEDAKKNKFIDDYEINELD